MIFNGALIKLNNDAVQSHGVFIESDDSPGYWAVKGVVREVGRPLFMKDPGHPLNHAKLALFEAAQDCTTFGIHPGDEVLVDYTARYNAVWIDGLLFVRHCDIICKVNPIVAVNGNIIVEIDDSPDENRGGVLLSHDRRKIDGHGTIVSASAPSKRKYGRDDIKIRAAFGDKVWFRNAWRIEADMIREYGALACVKPSDVYAIQSKDR